MDSENKVNVYSSLSCSELIKILKILASLTAGKTYSTTSQSILYHNSWSTALWRSRVGENRTQMLIEIENIFNECFNRFSNDFTYQDELLSSIKEACQGIKFLRETYNSDSTVVNIIDTLITKIEDKINTLHLELNSESNIQPLDSISSEELNTGAFFTNFVDPAIQLFIDEANKNFVHYKDELQKDDSTVTTVSELLKNNSSSSNELPKNEESILTEIPKNDESSLIELPKNDESILTELPKNDESILIELPKNSKDELPKNIVSTNPWFKNPPLSHPLEVATELKEEVKKDQIFLLEDMGPLYTLKSIPRRNSPAEIFSHGPKNPGFLRRNYSISNFDYGRK